MLDFLAPVPQRVCNDGGVADFQRLRQRKHLLIVFDLLELDGKDLRPEPIEVRKATLASVYSDFRLAPGKFHKKNLKI